jgi:hypothetical protein
MHTLGQLDTTLFKLRIDDEPVAVDALFQWGSHDRLGVVMTEPFGALGGSLAIQLAIASYFDFDGGGRRGRPHYAEVYLFHVGGRWGDFSLFDFWPSRREVFVADNPKQVLAAINSHGITHLLVPDGVPGDVEHDFKEPEGAFERLKICLAYGTNGTVADPDVLIASDQPIVLENMYYTLWPETLIVGPVEATRAADPLRLADHLRWREHVRSRLGEVGPIARQVPESRARLLVAEGKCTETYRRVTPQWAVQRLGPAPIT